MLRRGAQKPANRAEPADFGRPPQKNIAHNGAVTAPREQSGPTPPESAGRAGTALGAEPAAIPARCPVVRRPVCYRQDCRHWSNGCAHPEAVTRSRRPRCRAGGVGMSRVNQPLAVFAGACRAPWGIAH